MAGAKAIVPYMGAKRRLAKRIVHMLGPHDTYWEVPCGSLAVLLAKPQARNETVCDLSGNLINLARVVQERSTAEELYRMLDRILVQEDLIRESIDFSRAARERAVEESPDVEWAFHYMVGAWLGMAGTTGSKDAGRSVGVYYKRVRASKAKRWRNAIDSIPEWHRRLQSVLILSRCLFDVLPRIEDHPKTAIYCDPPYIGAKEYEHSLTFAQHAELAEQLQRFQRSTVVLSYGAAVPVGYENWFREQIEMQSGLSMSPRGRDVRGKTKKTEVILSNKPMVSQQRLFMEG